MTTFNSSRKLLITGGAGYVGAALVPKLLARGHSVRVLDWYIFGQNVLDHVKDNPRLQQVRGDIRDRQTLARSLAGADAVIHLACISNDPSAEINPTLTRQVNLDSFPHLVRLAKLAGVRTFIYASSSSVYGVSDQPDVTEDHPLHPLTDYSRFKARCEPILLEQQDKNFVPVVIRPATVCGYSARLRLDLTVNILTNHAVNTGKITVFGGDQMRPNIHIDDIAELYVRLLDEPDEKIAGKTWNAGYHNHTVSHIAQIVKKIVGSRVPGRENLQIVTTPANDHRSYHISSKKIERELGFTPKRSIEDAVTDLVAAFAAGKIPDAMSDPRYYNIKTMLAAEPQLAQAAPAA